jgi:carbonic anhydrase
MHPLSSPTAAGNQWKERGMNRMTPLLDNNKEYAKTYTPLALRPPARQVVLVSCLDHRVDTTAIFGLRTGDAPVIRNAGGRVNDHVIADVAYLSFLAEQLFRDLASSGPLFEVAVVHHTQCGTGFLADADFRRQAATTTGVPEPLLEESAVGDPYTTVRADVERLASSPQIPERVALSGHVYDIETGLVVTVVEGRSSLNGTNS